MLKGVNKQIIEIKCPESEHFEKILLFMKCENGYVPVKHLGSEIYQYYAQLVGREGEAAKTRRRSGEKTALLCILVGIIASSAIGLLSLLLIL